MNAEQKQALELRESGMSRAEIAAAMGLTERQVKTRLADARRWLESDPSAQFAAKASGANVMPRAYWVKSDGVSAYFQTPKEDDAVNLIDRVSEAFKDIPAYVAQPAEFTHSDLLTVYPVADAHVGLLAWGRETRGPDYDLELFKSDFITSMDRLSSRVPPSGHALLVFAGDTLHTPDSKNKTPAHGHILDVDGRFEKIVDVAVESITHTIDMLAQKHARVSVVVVRGNHCEDSHIILKLALKQRYRNVDRIDFPVVHGADKSEIFWMKHGKNLIAVHHGDKARPEKLAMIVADKCGFWDECTASRVILTGHLHHLRTLDLVGATHYTMRAFAPADSHGANYGGVRGLQAMTFDPKYGLVSQTHDGVWRD